MSGVTRISRASGAGSVGKRRARAPTRRPSSTWPFSSQRRGTNGGAVTRGASVALIEGRTRRSRRSDRAPGSSSARVPVDDEHVELVPSRPARGTSAAVETRRSPRAPPPFGDAHRHVADRTSPSPSPCRARAACRAAPPTRTLDAVLPRVAGIGEHVPRRPAAPAASACASVHGVGRQADLRRAAGRPRR